MEKNKSSEIKIGDNIEFNFKKYGNNIMKGTVKDIDDAGRITVMAFAGDQRNDVIRFILENNVPLAISLKAVIKVL